MIRWMLCSIVCFGSDRTDYVAVAGRQMVGDGAGQDMPAIHYAIADIGEGGSL